MMDKQKFFSELDVNKSWELMKDHFTHDHKTEIL